MCRDAIEVSREDLYEEVWAEPVSKVAQKYGITGTALSKNCRKNEIPTPPVGYWQRLQFGYKPQRPTLPPLPSGRRSTIRIEKSSPQPKRSPELEAQLASEDEEKNHIRVGTRLTHPHPFVRMTSDALQGRKADQYGMLLRPWNEKCLDVRVSRASVPRALRLFDALLKAVELRGFKVSVAEGGKSATYIQVGDQKLEISLEEKTTRKDHVLTKEETERKAKYTWSSAPKWDYEPAGILQFRIKEVWGDGARRTWSDRKQRRVEEMLNDIIGGLMTVAEAKRLHESELERQRREWADAERRRQEIEIRRQREAEQLRVLEQEATSWARSQQLRAYIDAVERVALRRAHTADEGTKIRQWLEWARRHAARLDPLTMDSSKGG